MFSRLVTSRFTSCLNGILRRSRKKLLHPQFVANDSLGVLTAVSERVALIKELCARREPPLRRPGWLEPKAP